MNYEVVIFEKGKPIDRSYKINYTLTKMYPTLGCCGIDCGLCPRFHTAGKSKCPGCLGENFFKKHPSCSIITCCVKKREHETCASCIDYLCDKMKHWDKTDSFVTHRKSLQTLQYIKDNDLKSFLSQQAERIGLLETMLIKFDDGRSKSFFCLAANLIPIEELKKTIRDASEKSTVSDRKTFSKYLKSQFLEIAKKFKIELTYRKNA